MTVASQFLFFVSQNSSSESILNNTLSIIGRCEIMGDHQARAEKLIEEADKKLTSGGGFFSRLMGGGQRNTEDAIDLYSQAANNFKIAKLWSEAGNAFKKAASLNSSISKHESASQYVEAATAFKKNNKEEAVKCLLEAVQVYEELGRFSIAAKHYASLGELYESDDILNIELAVKNFQKAADYYDSEESTSNANKFKLKVAHYSALTDTTEGYEKAVSIYEEVAARSIDNSLLKWSAKEYYFKAVLCTMCLRGESGEAITRYEEEFPSFMNTREHQLVAGLQEAINESNVDNFTVLVQEYDNISPLDKWLTSILLKIKKSINEDPDLC